MLKKYRPITPGTRRLVLPKNELLTRKKEGSSQTVEPLKSLLSSKKRTSGRNNLGRITCRHKGGGHKRKLREIDFKRNKDDIPGTVSSIEYDPNRSAYIALVTYADGEKRYIVATQGLKEGSKVMSGDNAPFVTGNAMRLKSMPLGSTVSLVELLPGKGAKMIRSAGMSAQLMARANGYATLRMPSGEMRMVHENCKASFGAVSNPEHNLRVEGKAGRNRWKGIRPTVRGTAMNPVDHPHGGGEGRSKGNVPQTPWAIYTRGLRTRSKKKSNKMIVKDRRKK